MATPQEPSEAGQDGSRSEDLDFEIQFYEGILKRLPESIDVLMALGNNYTQNGYYEKGLAVDERLCELRQSDPVVHYNLACSCSLLGRVDDAVRALEQAIAFGYSDYNHMQRDPDLENLRRDPRYVTILERALRKQLTN